MRAKEGKVIFISKEGNEEVFSRSKIHHNL